MKRHALCSDCEDKITPMDLPIPDGLKEEWSVSESRRQFLGRCGTVLGWASLQLFSAKQAFAIWLLRQAPSRSQDSARTPSGFHTSRRRPNAQFIYSCLVLRHRLIFSITNRASLCNSTKTCPPRFEVTNS